MNNHNHQLSLYDPHREQDSCGFGLIAQMDGKPSHWLIKTAIGALTRLTHRGAVAADGKTGDGCGLLLRKPDAFLRAVATDNGITLAKSYAVGMVFLNTHQEKAAQAKRTLSQMIEKQGLEVAGWRQVPINPNACGEEALRTLPVIEQIFVNAPETLEEEIFERHLYVARRQAENLLEKDDETFYIPSLSARLICYKGMIMPAMLTMFFPDLGDERVTSSLAVFHQRFSTNTLPQWRLAHPFRYLAHNGEINTIAGNRNWSVARGYKFKTPLIPDMASVRPLVSATASDSYSLDNMLEALVMGGMDIFRAMRLLIPPAWQNVDTMDADLRAFYQYHSLHMEPWDGPAGIVLTDSRYAACVLDRNGLRPARYVLTQDRHITLASEIGVYDYSPEEVVTKGRLKPGEMMAIDTQTGQLLLSHEIDEKLKERQPYKRWLHEHAHTLSPTWKTLSQLSRSPEQLQSDEKRYLVSLEEREQVVRVLAESGQEAVGSMGDDTPFAVLSQRARSIYDYFRQQFAQVTNPPIDPLREQIVMSLETILGPERNLFEETPQHAERVVLESPILTCDQFQALDQISSTMPYASHLLSLGYTAEQGLQAAVESLANASVQAVREGKPILILSDQNIPTSQMPIHAALAVGAVHQRLIDEGLRCDANLIVATATARDPHHFSVLLGFGATAVYPYLAYEMLHDLIRTGDISGKAPDALADYYRKGIQKGLFKVISKMGISAIVSYRGAKLFEIVGLHDEVVKLCFPGTASRIQGATFADLQKEQESVEKRAQDPREAVEVGGLLKYVHGGEYHAYNPDVVKALQEAVHSGEYHHYQRYAKLVNERQPTTLRDLFKLRNGVPPIPVDQVEPIEAILPRFDTAAMSLGALSPEAHESLAMAMNRLGGRSNSGEGGEDPARYGTEKVSKIKQVASGRFGVTPAYLVNAEVLQIKVAQGAKPGEGGQLPGDKVNQLIATLRYTRPGVPLISPPPHHDIYSIEDLAQLIFDLKQVNPQALVSVKLVSEPGVGTIAAGVAKAYADLITISGYDGGTGASPIASVKYAGSPWELGLSETHQTLLANDLRGKVRLQTDGGLKTGLDVIKAAILGAESFGFGTAPMVVLGCKYLRICHLNNCATGIATQHDTLRAKHFTGTPEHVIHYFRFLAQEVRELMAQLGVARLADLVGRTDLLEIVSGKTSKQQHLNLSPMLSKNGLVDGRSQCCISPHNDPFDKGELAEQMVKDALPAIENLTQGEFHYTIKNNNRSLGARVSGEIARRHGNQGMTNHPVTIRFTGTAGQSFGVWNAGGLHLMLEGDANDYVGKGMTGGMLVIRPPKASLFKEQENVIIGNTCLYGATGGKLFAAGLAGERFAVRNSGAIAVVEGVGDHGCEYMTGGVVVILGATGLNFGAGMTGGFAYVLDQDGRFPDSYNHEMVDIYRIDTERMAAQRTYLQELLQEFTDKTESEWGKTILEQFEDHVGKFWLIKPKIADLDSLLLNIAQAA